MRRALLVLAWLFVACNSSSEPTRFAEPPPAPPPPGSSDASATCEALAFDVPACDFDAGAFPDKRTGPFGLTCVYESGGQISLDISCASYDAGACPWGVSDSVHGQYPSCCKRECTPGREIALETDGGAIPESCREAVKGLLACCPCGQP